MILSFSLQKWFLERYSYFLVFLSEKWLGQFNLCGRDWNMDAHKKRDSGWNPAKFHKPVNLPSLPPLQQALESGGTVSRTWEDQGNLHSHSPTRCLFSFESIQ